MMNIVGVYQPLEDLRELEQNGLSIMEDDTPILRNNIIAVLEAKGLNVSDLSTITGISRQNINAVVHNKMKPGVDFALKVSQVLGVSVNELFELTEEAWIRPYKKDRDIALFIDMIHMAIVDNKQKKAFIEENGFEFYNVKTNEQVTKADYEERLRQFIDSKRVALTEKMKEEEPDLTANQIKSAVVEQLRSEFHEEYSKIYKRLGKNVPPYTV